MYDCMNNKLSLDNFQAVIFDLDNLLVDSEKLWPEIDAAFFSEYLGEDGWQIWQPLWLEQKKAMVQLKEIMADVKERFNKPETPAEIIEARMEKMFSVYRQKLQPLPGADKILRELHSQGLRLAIASGMKSKVIDFVVALMGWNDLIAVKVSTHDCAHNKPFPDVYLKVAELLRLKPQECLAFENDLNGVSAAKAAGLFTVAVPYPARDLEEINKVADRVMKNLDVSGLFLL